MKVPRNLNLNAGKASSYTSGLGENKLDQVKELPSPSEKKE